MNIPEMALIYFPLSTNIAFESSGDVAPHVGNDRLKYFFHSVDKSADYFHD